MTPVQEAMLPAAGAFRHDYDFDPAYGYSLNELLAVAPPAPPPDYAALWQHRFNRAISVQPRPEIRHSGEQMAGFEVFDLNFTSTSDFVIGGWVLIPKREPVMRGMVIGHGYGGRDAPDTWLATPGTAMLFPCFRGLALSQREPISAEPRYHVLHNIDNPASYILGGCAEDIWLAVSALQVLFPAIGNRIGYSGMSFGGGVGALALPWDKRIARAHFNVPTFGHQSLRLTLPTIGSGESVRRYEAEHHNVMETLQYYDAANAASFITQPVHMAAALFDPAVAPPGQFAVYNAVRGEKSLNVLEAGHFSYPGQEDKERALQTELKAFFSSL